MGKTPYYLDRRVYSSLIELIEESFTRYKDHILFKYEEDGIDYGKTYHDVFCDIKSVASYLKGLNLKNKHIAIIGKTTYKWLISYLGVIYSGGVAIPIDKDLMPEEIIRQLDFADVECLMFDNDFNELAHIVKSKVPKLKVLINLHDGDEGFLTLSNVMEKGSKAPLKTAGDIRPTNTAQILFTSGTTGTQRAVVLTHENIAYNVAFATSILNESYDYTTMSILPNNHSYELTTDILTPISFGMTVSINDSLKKFKKNLQKYKPTILVAVPIVLEMMRNEVIREAKKSGQERKLKMGMAVSKALLKVGVDVRKRLFKDIHNAFGGRLFKVVSGGAFLPLEVYDFFTNIGVTTMVGYGITECSPLVSANTDKFTKRASVGKVYERFCDVKIVDGEIYIKGKSVTPGYYKTDAVGASLFEDGWYKTGDLGYIDKQGFLYIEGRKKNLIILNNGQNVSPEEIENLLMQRPIVKETIVYAKSNIITAEIFPNSDLIEEADKNRIEVILNEEVKLINANLPIYKQVQKIIVRDTPFDKTTTHKIKR